MSSWSSLEKGDIIHALVFNRIKATYEYQEISINQNKIWEGGNMNILHFKITKEGKRMRVTLDIPLNYHNKIILENGMKGRYGDNLYALSKEDLINNYKLFSEYEIQTLKQSIFSTINTIKLIRENVKTIDTL